MPPSHHNPNHPTPTTLLSALLALSSTLHHTHHTWPAYGKPTTTATTPLLTTCTTIQPLLNTLHALKTTLSTHRHIDDETVQIFEAQARRCRWAVYVFERAVLGMECDGVEGWMLMRMGIGIRVADENEMVRRSLGNVVAEVEAVVGFVVDVFLAVGGDRGGCGCARGSGDLSTYPVVANASAKSQDMGIFIGIDQMNKLQHQQAYNSGPDKTRPRSAGLEHRLMDGDRDMDVWLHARADDDDGDGSPSPICFPLKISDNCITMRSRSSELE
ncbi:hypothetical protein FQN55_005754 [Onygenales sp. PD_40]|nr:hypothetical protein FQN55_005754 [Onygenales sp. PD_40]